MVAHPPFIQGLPFPSPLLSARTFLSYIVLLLGDHFCVLGTCTVYKSGLFKKKDDRRLCVPRDSSVGDPCYIVPQTTRTHAHLGFVLFVV
jgi:hypothetical protein